MCEKPIVLYYGGYGGHYFLDNVTRYIELKATLVVLSENLSHLIYPLDIAIFKTFKTFFKRHMEYHIIENPSPPFPILKMFQFHIRRGKK